MLESLHLQNFILVRDMFIDFGYGLNGITGETGAGKSLIIKSLELLAGQQASEDCIYPEQNFAYIEAIFKLPSDINMDDLTCDDGRLIVSRRIQRDRATVNKVNGEAVPLKQLKQIMERLLFITSQHQVYELLDASNHLNFFDQYIGKEVNLLKGRYQSEYNELCDLKKQSQTLRSEKDGVLRELHDLSNLVSDIDSQEFSLEEETRLIEQQQQIQSLQAQRSAVGSVIQRISQTIEGISVIDDDLKVLNEHMAQPISFDAMQSMESLRDIEQLVSKRLMDIEYLESVDVNDINQRLDTIFKYCVKYQVSKLSDLLDLRERSEKKKVDIESSSDLFQTVEKKLVSQERMVATLAKQLSKLRGSFVKGFNFLVTDQLKQLGMVDSKFSIDITQKEDYGSNGLDLVEFLFSANPNSDLKPLKSCASGGELSRVLLALLVSNNYIVSQPLLVFDEIDVGIGGITANYIGNLMSKLSEKTQLIVVTHLPQIARYSNFHFKLLKTVQNKESCVTISKLTKEDVSVELQRMVGGDVVASLIK